MVFKSLHSSSSSSGASATGLPHHQTGGGEGPQRKFTIRSAWWPGELVEPCAERIQIDSIVHQHALHPHLRHLSTQQAASVSVSRQAGRQVSIPGASKHSTSRMCVELGQQASGQTGLQLGCCGSRRRRRAWTRTARPFSAGSSGNAPPCASNWSRFAAHGNGWKAELTVTLGTRRAVHPDMHER